MARRQADAPQPAPPARLPRLRWRASRCRRCWPAPMVAAANEALPPTASRNRPGETGGCDGRPEDPFDKRTSSPAASVAAADQAASIPAQTSAQKPVFADSPDRSASAVGVEADASAQKPVFADSPLSADPGMWVTSQPPAHVSNASNVPSASTATEAPDGLPQRVDAPPGDARSETVSVANESATEPAAEVAVTTSLALAEARDDALINSSHDSSEAVAGSAECSVAGGGNSVRERRGAVGPLQRDCSHGQASPGSQIGNSRTVPAAWVRPARQRANASGACVAAGAGR